MEVLFSFRIVCCNILICQLFVLDERELEKREIFESLEFEEELMLLFFWGLDYGLILVVCFGKEQEKMKNEQLVMEEELFVEYFKMLMDEEFYMFLEWVDVIFVGMGEDFLIVKSQLEEKEIDFDSFVELGLVIFDFICVVCGDVYVMKKRCLNCNRVSCIICLLKGNGWLEEQLECNVQVCWYCEFKIYVDICKDSVMLYLIKIGFFLLGLGVVSRNRIRRLSNKYQWENKLQMLMKRVGKKYGRCLVFDFGEREVLIRDVYGLGYLGIVRVVGVIVEIIFGQECGQKLRGCCCNVFVQ